MLFGFPGYHAFDHRPTYLQAEGRARPRGARGAAGRPGGARDDPGRAGPAARPGDAVRRDLRMIQHGLSSDCTRSAIRPTTSRRRTGPSPRIAARARRGSAGDAVRPDARVRRGRDADAAVLQLRRGQPRRDPRHDHAPRGGVGPVRRRRALRPDLRRVDPDVPADPLGPRPAPRSAAARWSTWCASRPSTPRRCSGCATAA